jgi:CRP-like cAMP-binding protein
VDYGVTVGLLSRIPLFAEMNGRSLKMLAFSSDYFTVEDGEELCHEGEPPDGVFIIENGDVEVLVARDGVTSRIAVVGHHQVVGEIAVILNQPRSATVRALGRVRVLKIDAQVFLAAVTEHPTAALSVLRTLCERLTNMIRLYERNSARAG